MLFLTRRLHEILMNQFPDLAPRLAIIHHQQVISLGNQISNYGRWPVAVYVALLIQQIPDQFTVRDDQCGIRESFQTENPAEPFCPFGQPGAIQPLGSPPTLIASHSAYKKCPSAAGI